MNEQRVRGVWCASLTPVDQEGNIDNGRFRDHARWLLSEGVDGIAPFGTTGEGQSFTVAERRAGVEALLAGGIEARRIAPATGCASLRDTIELTRHAVQAGCAGVLVLPPFFFKGVGDDAVVATYTKLIESVGESRLRVYLYHIPQVTAVPIGTRALADLVARFPEVIAGVKDSSGDLEHSLALVKQFPQLDILVGHEPHLPHMVPAGGAGTICGLANLFPRAIRSLYESRDPAVLARDVAFAERAIAALKPHSAMPALKGIKARLTGDRRWLGVREPLLPMTESSRQVLGRALDALDAGIAAAA